jgi:hypothetical protein
MKAFTARIRLAVFAACFAFAAPAHAQQQQQWAAAYVDWSFAETPAGIGIAQDIWVPQPARTSFFTLNFDFVTGDGGYIGLQSDEHGVGNVRFSLWNTTVARGESCRPFDGEGEGMTCVLPFPINPQSVYRLHVTRGDADASGQWWIGWVQEQNGAERQIGAIKVPRQHRSITSTGVTNFSEFWGDAVAACQNVPLSAAAFAAPTLMTASGGASLGAQPNGTRAEENRCTSGRERLGAVVAHTPLQLRGAQAMVITLGGTPEANRALAQATTTAAPGR